MINILPEFSNKCFSEKPVNYLLIIFIMSLLDRINIEEFLDPASELPPDVTFVVQDQEDKTVGKVVGHKMYLATVSVVFRRIFFGAENKDKHSKVVNIKETTLAAFQTMVGMVYKKKAVDEILKDLMISDIFEVGNLAERYQLPW